MPRGLAPGTSSTGGRRSESQPGLDAIRSAPSFVTPSLWWLTITYRSRARRSGDIASICAKSLTVATRPWSTSGRVGSLTWCIHPLPYGVPIHRARSMPSASGPNVPQCIRTSWLVWAPRLSPNSTTSGRGPVRSRSRLLMRSQSRRFCSRASLTLSSDSGDGRLEYCSVTVAMSPRVRYSAAAVAQ